MKKLVFGFLMIAGLAANANAQFPAHYPRPFLVCNDVKAGPDHGYRVKIVILPPVANAHGTRYGAILEEQTIMGPRALANYPVNGGNLNGAMSFASRDFSLEIRSSRNGRMPAEMVADLHRTRIGARMVCGHVYTTLNSAMSEIVKTQPYPTN